MNNFKYNYIHCQCSLFNKKNTLITNQNTNLILKPKYSLACLSTTSSNSNKKSSNKISINNKPSIITNNINNFVLSNHDNKQSNDIHLNIPILNNKKKSPRNLQKNQKIFYQKRMTLLSPFIEKPKQKMSQRNGEGEYRKSTRIEFKYNNKNNNEQQFMRLNDRSKQISTKMMKQNNMNSIEQDIKECKIQKIDDRKNRKMRTLESKSIISSEDEELDRGSQFSEVIQTLLKKEKNEIKLIIFNNQISIINVQTYNNQFQRNIKQQ